MGTGVIDCIMCAHLDKILKVVLLFLAFARRTVSRCLGFRPNFVSRHLISIIYTQKSPFKIIHTYYPSSSYLLVNMGFAI